MGNAVERIFLPLVKKTMPEIVDMHLPGEGVFHNLMIVSIDKRYPGHARKVDARDLGHGQMMFTKCRGRGSGRRTSATWQEVAWKALNHIDPERDVQFTRAGGQTRHASRLPDFGSKMGIDATRKWTAEGFSALAGRDRDGPRGEGRRSTVSGLPRHPARAQREESDESRFRGGTSGPHGC